MVSNFQKNWKYALDHNETNYKIKTYDTIVDFKINHIEEYNLFIFYYKPNKVVKIKFSSSNLYKINLTNKHEINCLFKKPNKYRVVFDFNFTSLFLLNHPPFNSDSIFLQKIDRNSLFKNKKVKWLVNSDKCRFNQIDIKNNYNKYQSLILELIEKSPCIYLNFTKLIGLFKYYHSSEEINLESILKRIKHIKPDYNYQYTDIKDNKDYLEFVILPCYQLNIFYKVDIKPFIVMDDYEKRLKQIKKNTKVLILDKVDTLEPCFKCKYVCTFTIIFGQKYNICKFCHLENIKDLSIIDKRIKIVNLESKWREIGLSEKDIFQIRNHNSYITPLNI